MKLILEPSAAFFRTDDGVLMRAWHGHTDDGTPVIAFIAAITVSEGASEEQQGKLRRALVSIPGPMTADAWVRPER